MIGHSLPKSRTSGNPTTMSKGFIRVDSAVPQSMRRTKPFLYPFQYNDRSCCLPGSVQLKPHFLLQMCDAGGLKTDRF